MKKNSTPLIVAALGCAVAAFGQQAPPPDRDAVRIERGAQRNLSEMDRARQAAERKRES